MALKKYIVRAVLISLALFFAVGCGVLHRTEEKHVWRVGTDVNFAPLSFYDEKSGDVVGFDIDIIRSIAAAQGKEVQIEPMNFDALIPALQKSDIDIAVSNITINEERMQHVDFTDSYYRAGLSIVVPVYDEQIQNFSDLQGLRVGVMEGSTGAEAAYGIPDARLHMFGDIAEAFAALANGDIDAVVHDTPMDEYYVQNRGKGVAKVVPAQINQEEIGAAVAKGDDMLREKFNMGLRTIQKNGTYAKIYKKWFGKDTAD